MERKPLSRLINQELADMTGAWQVLVPLVQPWYTNCRYVSSHEVFSAIWRSLVSDKDDYEWADASPESAPYEFGHCFMWRCSKATQNVNTLFNCRWLLNMKLEFWGNSLHQCAIPTETKICLNDLFFWDAFDRRIEDIMYERKLVVTASGWIGVVPFNTQPNDRICILSGGKTP
jgi:hypothetical protein